MCRVAIERAMHMRLHRLHIACMRLITRSYRIIISRRRNKNAFVALHEFVRLHAMRQPQMPFGKHEPELNCTMTSDQCSVEKSNLCARTCFAVSYLIAAAICQTHETTLNRTTLSPTIYWRTNFATTAIGNIKIDKLFTKFSLSRSLELRTPYENHRKKKLCTLSVRAETASHLVGHEMYKNDGNNDLIIWFGAKNASHDKR